MTATKKWRPFPPVSTARTSCERIVDPVSGEVIVDINDLINEKQAEQLEKIGIERLKIRSVLTCELKRAAVPSATA